MIELSGKSTPFRTAVVTGCNGKISNPHHPLPASKKNLGNGHLLWKLPLWAGSWCARQAGLFVYFPEKEAKYFSGEGNRKTIKLQPPYLVGFKGINWMVEHNLVDMKWESGMKKKKNEFDFLTVTCLPLEVTVHLESRHLFSVKFPVGQHK
ncbi:hypothetical protein BDP27DRAFT_1371905 [Rhodocollybia butyracea]|uniref:Uncharacterized protein n=1 Tax=Rhodocollybia butyracea TaxID=206335 RepID=A0A9P5P835_9AGAR|nr:hypothetical protein BDP27DRAFT_1371905 [Rhodocollybia butyracea]